MKSRSNAVSGLADMLGWFSLALGVAQLSAPRTLRRYLGLNANPATMRLIGLRETLNGVAILTQRNKSIWIKARIAGDLMDLAFLAASLRPTVRGSTRGLLATLGTVAGITALDLICDRKLRSNGRKDPSPEFINVSRSITIDHPAMELYEKWRDLARLPAIMTHLESVTVLDEKRSRWVAKAPAGFTVEWDAAITVDIPGQRIAWRSLEGAKVANQGAVNFRPATGNRGTVVTVQLQYYPPGGIMASGLARLFGKEPDKQLAVDLRRFKQLIETGEIATTAGQPAGRKKSTSRLYDEAVRT